MREKSKEKIDLIKSEMANYLTFYYHKQQLIEKEISQRETKNALQSSSYLLYFLGSIHFLKQMLDQVNSSLSEGINLFSEHIEIPVPLLATTNTSSISVILTMMMMMMIFQIPIDLVYCDKLLMFFMLCFLLTLI